MTATNPFPLVAVDVGNRRVKLGVFQAPLAEPLPCPVRSLALELDWDDAELQSWLDGQADDFAWSIASVNRPAANRLIEWLTKRRASRIHMLTHVDVPLRIDLSRPDQVGLDRLTNAVAVNRLRAENEPAIVIAVGTAITVDLVSKSGSFAGGAIVPGIEMSARALHEFTDLLPLVEVSAAPAALGKSTQEAMQSGLYWGALGAVRELVARLAEGSPSVQIFTTGGAAPILAENLGETSQLPPRSVRI